MSQEVGRDLGVPMRNQNWCNLAWYIAQANATGGENTVDECHGVIGRDLITSRHRILSRSGHTLLKSKLTAGTLCLTNWKTVMD